MTWRWRTCFSALALACAALPAGAAAVSGSVHLTDSRDPEVRKRQDYSGVVVWLEPIGPAPAVTRRPPVRARMEQRGKRFIPHVIAVQAGASIDFPNFDPIFHNAFSSFSGQIFDLGLYAPGTNKAITFTRTGIVRVFCNIHPTMSAVIAVLRDPWLAVTNGAGAFAIEDVPPGDYTLRVFHERSTAETLRSLQSRIKVGEASLALQPIAISETGHVEAPHLNKYGHEYPPLPNEGGYPGGR
jgi:plastocyanin